VHTCNRAGREVCEHFDVVRHRDGVALSAVLVDTVRHRNPCARHDCRCRPTQREMHSYQIPIDMMFMPE
jgi:hypothetical protein